MTALLLYLASASPRRREILQNLGYRIERIAADIDETPLPQEDAADYVQRLAAEKNTAALAVWQAAGKTEPAAPVIAADTTVALDGKILGKPDRPNTRAKCCSPFPAAAIRCIPPSACITKAASSMP